MKAMFKLVVAILLPLFLWNCKTTAYPEYNDPIPAHDTFTIQSKNVDELRTINVWIPEDYKNSTEEVDVLYMPDGGTKEDFPHIANTLDELIKAKKIKPILLVGIENTQRRRDLTGKTDNEEDKKIAPTVGGASEFRAFIKDELFDEIQKRYRVTDKKGIIGESLAGLFIVETFLKQPDMFDYYIAMDPSLWWNNHKMVQNAKHDLLNFTASNKKIWFASSKATDIVPYSQELSKTLKETNSKNIQWQYSNEPKEDHSTIYRATKEKALIWSLN
ncbi:alpha/beta hydrolase [Empedobacter brevis]|uniref:alpha/beta hydrolase n=1 Tax=Empedobacter brevis TaxID=247 RepID=UPI0028A73098|nr:alpha/beta hydrolase-fold protein [Empedobacter brevis]